jgi:Ca2+:H+ antiporter
MRLLSLLAYAAIPLAFLCHFLLRTHSWQPTATFILAALGVIPLAHLMGESTENLSERTGPTWGGLLNATFGNAAELIIAIIGLTKGLNDIVKASLTGSILGNLLLVAGAAMLVGGWKREKQSFNPLAAETSAGLLAVAVAAMLMPAVFHFSFRLHDPHLYEHEHRVSIGTSIILLIVYALGLLFTLKTHAHIFTPTPAASPEQPPGVSSIHGRWSIRRASLTLLAASVGIAIVAELLVGSAQVMAHHLGWNPIFVGVILLAIIGNAAEHSTALMLARRNDMDTALSITSQSSLQIALFVTPLLVLLSSAMVTFGIGHAHIAMDLIFSPMEVVAVFLSVAIVVLLSLNGQCNWFEGVLLLALYAILAIVFFYIPAGPEAR